MGHEPTGHKPRPANTLAGLGGRKPIQDAQYTINLGRPPSGRLASAQCPVAPGLPGEGHPRERPRPGQGAPMHMKAETPATRPLCGGLKSPSPRLTRAVVPWGFSG